MAGHGLAGQDVAWPGVIWRGRQDKAPFGGIVGWMGKTELKMRQGAARLG